MAQLNLEYDADALAAPQSFRNGVQAAANILDATILNPIAVGYGEVGLNTPFYTPLFLNYSLGGARTPIQVSYTALMTALGSNETAPSDVTSVNALPLAASLNGTSSFDVSSALAKAFGAIPSNDPAIDGDVGFPASFTGNTLLTAAIVEEVHALGLQNARGDLGLFSYISPGNHFLPPGTTSATPAYF